MRKEVIIYRGVVYSPRTTQEISYHYNFSKPDLVGRTMTISIPKDAHILICGPCEYVISHGKGEVRLKMELRLLISCH